MTSRRFAQLCAQGKLEWRHEPSNSGVIYHEYLYVEGDEDVPVSVHVTKNFEGGQDRVQVIVARTFDEKDWHEPQYFDDYIFKEYK